jgi:hypothetical protein
MFSLCVIGISSWDMHKLVSCAILSASNSCVFLGTLLLTCVLSSILRLNSSYAPTILHNRPRTARVGQCLWTCAFRHEVGEDDRLNIT